MLRKYYFLMLLGAIVGAVMLFCLYLLVSGKASLAINGFAVDAEGRLYIGQEDEIVVFKNGVCVQTISPHTSRTYAFTVTDDQTILLSTSTKVYTMDLAGNILTEQLDEGTRIYNQLQHKKSFKDVNGAEYVLRSPWGRTGVYKDGQQIYTMSTMDYTIKAAIEKMEKELK